MKRKKKRTTAGRSEGAKRWKEKEAGKKERVTQEQGREAGVREKSRVRRANGGG